MKGNGSYIDNSLNLTVCCSFNVFSMTFSNLKEQPFSNIHDIIVGSIFRQVEVERNFFLTANVVLVSQKKKSSH